MKSYLPSIWLAEFACEADWKNAPTSLKDSLAVMDCVDDRMLSSRHPFEFRGWCAVCDSISSLQVTWHYAGNREGSVNPAWTETAVCRSCKLNSRMRALYRFLIDRCTTNLRGRTYVAEQVTRFYKILRSRAADIVGSEYVGSGTELGGRKLLGRQLVRNEDLTQLTFDSGSFDLVVTQDVFEHVPSYTKAFLECYRVLKPKGQLVFSIPFFPELAVTRVRAELSQTGEVTHILEPEYHGNPLGQGSLCFQNFGWDLLDSLREAGFSHAEATMYWGPWSGHLGCPAFIFRAQA